VRRSFDSLSPTMGALKTLVFSTFFFVSSLAASANDWRSRSIYQVSRIRSFPSIYSPRGHQLVTDRFATDGPGPTCNTEDRKYCGGTYRGIINYLDYIQNMGFDAIWISPVVATFEGSSAYGEGYHGLVFSSLAAVGLLDKLLTVPVLGTGRRTYFLSTLILAPAKT